MTSSKEFKQAIREGRLNDAFVIAMGNAPELHITTWIASPEDTSSKPREGACLRTHVNLVEGEIVNEIGEQLIGDNLYSTLQKFHLRQVTQGHQTISQNLQSIQQMFRLLAILKKQQNGENYTPINTWKIANTSLPSTSVANENFSVQPSQENTNFPLIVESNDSQFADENEEDVIEDLLSLDELDIDIEQPEDNESNIKKSSKDGEDWGDWLDENDNESDINAEMLDLESLDLDDSEDWEEDWEGDETEFMSNTTLENTIENKDESEDRRNEV